MHRFDVKTITTTQNYESDQIIMHCNNLTSKRSKKLSYVPKLQKWSNYNELHGFDVKTIKNVEVRRKTFKTSQIYKTDQIKPTQNYNELHRFDVKTIKNVEVRRKTFKTTQNYKTDQITMNCIDLMSKTSNQRKTTKVIKLQWIASIWCENDQNFWVTSLNYESHQTTMNCIDLMSKTSNQRKTTKVILFRWICIDLTSKRSKTLRYVAKLSKQRKTTKLIKLQWTASIWHQNNQKCWVTSQNIQNNANLQNWSNYNELHRFDVKTIKKRKTTKAIK